jgi:predicted RNase H-like nuclease
VVIAVDAPLVVPNDTGNRPCEVELAKVFRKYHAGAHPANRTLLSHYNKGNVRGELLVEQLEAIGIRHAMAIQPRQPTRQVFEAYPHPAMVMLFDLQKTLKYKARLGRDLAQRQLAFHVYRNYLLNLSSATPSATLELLELDQSFKGKRLKGYEDRIDAVFCAYIALYYWWWGMEKCRIFGTMDDGYIVTPYFDRAGEIKNDQSYT